MALQDDFIAAAARSKTLSERPSNEDLLTLYALYKQGNEGDVQGKRPGMLDPVGRAKFDAWTAKKGMDKAKAQQTYIDLVAKLAG